MVIKKCKICGEEFEARGRALTCSPECREIFRRDNHRKADKKYRESDKGKATRKRYTHSEKGKAAVKKAVKKYQQTDKGKAVRKKANKKYLQTDKGKAAKKRADKKYYESDKGKAVKKKAAKKYQQTDKYKEYQREYQKEYKQKKIAELNEKYDGDLESILKDCPNSWLVREAIMLVKYGVSYAEAMYQKEKNNPVCEVTGESGNLVNHHLDSFNLYPEKGADLDNIVRVKSEIHDDFHNIYGRGSNTREQWFEFLEKNKYNINK